jgi:hypothetical protein
MTSVYHWLKSIERGVMFSIALTPQRSASCCTIACPRRAGNRHVSLSGDHAPSNSCLTGGAHTTV